MERDDDIAASQRAEREDTGDMKLTRKPVWQKLNPEFDDMQPIIGILLEHVGPYGEQISVQAKNGEIITRRLP